MGAAVARIAARRAGAGRRRSAAAIRRHGIRQLHRARALAGAHRLRRRDEQGRRPPALHVLRQRASISSPMRTATSTRGRTSAAAHRGSISAARPSTCASASTTSTGCTATATRSPRTRSAISTAPAGRRPTGTRNSALPAGARTNVGPNNGLAETEARLPAQRGDRLPRTLSGQESRPLFGPQEQRLSLRHQRRRPIRCVAGEDRRHLAFQSGDAADRGLGQGHAVDGLQFLRGAFRCRERSAPLRAGARADAADLSRIISRPTTPATARPLHIGHHFAAIRAAPTTRR